MTATITEIESIESLDFDPSIKCESKEGCDLEAAWLLIITCCGSSIPLCLRHKVRFVRWLESEGAIVNNEYDCRGCGNRWPTSDPWRFIQLMPL